MFGVVRSFRCSAGLFLNHNGKAGIDCGVLAAVASWSGPHLHGHGASDNGPAVTCSVENRGCHPPPHSPSRRPSRRRRSALSLMKRSEEHTSELQSLMRISYAVFCLKKKKQT